MKRNLHDGLGMAEEGAKGSITQLYLWQPLLAGPDSPPESPASWKMIRVPGCVCPRFPDLSAQKALVQALIRLRAGEGPVPCCPGTQAGCSALAPGLFGAAWQGNLSWHR